MDSVRPKLSEVAGENDDTSQLEDEKRRHIQISDQACLVSAKEEGSVDLNLDNYIEYLELYLLRQRDIYKNEYPLDLAHPNATPSGYTSIFASMYNQPQPSEPPSNQHRARPEVRIDISDGEEWMTCPRCDSPNTKLIGHYDEYGLFPPRHYCKKCRNCWTKADTLQNIASSSAATAAAKHPVSAASAEDKKGSQNSNNRGEIAVTLSLILKEPGRSTVGYGYKEWHLHNQTGRKYRDVGPNIVTGSGSWEPSGTNNPTYYSNSTPSGPNYTSIFAPMDNQPQPSEPPSNQHPARPQVRIDISDGNTKLSIHQSWKEYIDQLKNSLCDDDAMKIMSGTLTTVAGQFIGGLMVHKITSSAAAPYSWAGSAVEIATVLGLCVTLAGISLRGRSRAHSALVIKIGAVITASAIVFSMGLHLPLAMALTVGPVMFLIMAVAAAFA